MKKATVLGCAFGTASIAVLLAGCNNGASSSGLPSGLASSGFSPADRLSSAGLNPFAARARFHPHRLWISPEVKKGKPRLLFVTTYGAKTLNVYSMPDMIERGQVGGFQYPFGECADGSGQVWVVDSDTDTITRFSRSLDVTGELDDNYGFPLSCAVDPTTGTLAVSNQASPSGPGNVVLYKHARGSGTPVSNPNQSECYWLGYSRNGTLWVDGYEHTSFFALSSCGASSCKTIPIHGGTIYGPGFLQWAVGQHSWYIADSRCGGHDDRRRFCIYPVSESGALGTAIRLKDVRGRPVCALDQGVITSVASRVLVGGVYGVHYNGDCQYLGFAEVDRWNFPAGGTATNESDSVVTFPYGAAISSR